MNTNQQHTDHVDKDREEKSSSYLSYILVVLFSILFTLSVIYLLPA
jgi:hypothetical protein